ncbi:MAG: MerR family transcriptional regulator [Bacteroidales bacterium]|nr:MerR family transcriptional regulator [Bacteroidales bacterium]MCD8393337.1 MerR family transcriptional regulator [Bacteroidales bacterium]
MNDPLSKKYYKISEVAEIVDLPMSTLRFWEKEFTIIHPKRNDKGSRFYTPKDIEKIRQVKYLVKEKGLKLDAAQAMIKRNPEGIEREARVIETLRSARETVSSLLAAIGK